MWPCAELEAVFRPFHLISIAPDLDKSKFYDYKAYFNNELSGYSIPNTLDLLDFEKF